MSVVSSGIIPYTYKNGEILFFAGHPGGCRFDYWALLKGQCNSCESFKDAAVREFGEESGIKLTEDEVGRLEYLGSVKQNREKIVHAFALHVDYDRIDASKCVSNPADNCTWNEIDRYAWFTYDEIIARTHKTHKMFYNKIIEHERHLHDKQCCNELRFGEAIDRG